MTATLDTQRRVREGFSHLLAHAQSLADITKEHLAQQLQVSVAVIGHALPHGVWKDGKYTWLHCHIQQSLDTIFATARTRADASRAIIATHAGIAVEVFTHLAHDEWYARWQALPIGLVEWAIRQLVATNTPLAAYTWASIYATAQLPQGHATARQCRLFRAGYDQLAQQQHQEQHLVPERPLGSQQCLVDGRWIDLAADAWHVPPHGTLHRAQLRQDIATVAWPLLQEELRTKSCQSNVVVHHFRAYRKLSQLLGEHVPDIGLLSLVTLQQAWIASPLLPRDLAGIRTVLIRLLEYLIVHDVSGDSMEWGRAMQWLRTVKMRSTAKPTPVFLAEDAFDAVLLASLEDVAAGVTFMQAHPAPFPQQLQVDESTLLVNWGAGLVVLVMAFTGLRRQSVSSLTERDIAAIGPKTYALAWRHGKKREEHIAIIPEFIVQMLHAYLQFTAPRRQQLGLTAIFLADSKRQRWDQLTPDRTTRLLRAFCQRHALTQNDVLLTLGSTIMRRTFVTRSLYESQDIAALRAQLGHATIATTMRYFQFEHFEHAAHVQPALEAFGRKVLPRWHAPLILSELAPDERQALLGVRSRRDVEMGLCRHDHCIQIADDHTPPCSLCAHLVTGPEFFGAWEREKQSREATLRDIARQPEATILFAQYHAQYTQFCQNYVSVQKRSTS